MNIPIELLNSYRDWESYPRNLLDKTIHDTQASALQSWLDGPDSGLCVEPTSLTINVGFRDFYPWRDDCDKINVINEVKLAERLGDQSPLGQSITKQDPTCRFIFLTADSGRSSLKISTAMLQRILSYHQVPPIYLGTHLRLFGDRELDSDLKFGSLWSRISFEPPKPNMMAPDIGRHGQHYELCYNLKGVQNSQDNKGSFLSQWSVRHGAIYHKLDVVAGTTVWIITKAGLQLKDRVRDATNNISRTETRDFSNTVSCFRSSLAMHLLIVQEASENWWSCLRDLETLLMQQIDFAQVRKADTKSFSGKMREVYTRSHLETVLRLEEKAAEAAAVFETNISVLQSLGAFYKGLKTDSQFPLGQTADVIRNIDNFLGQLHAMEQEFETLRSRANYLTQHARSRKELILNFMQAQTSDSMSDMTRRSIEEAVAVRVITVVTLIYLPATFVSTFFSTDIVKYQPGNNDQLGYHTQYSHLAMMRWLQVTLPLTAVTLTIALGLYLWSRQSFRPFKQTEPV